MSSYIKKVFFMRSAHVLLAQRLSCMPDETLGSHPVIQVTTDLPAGQMNSFYIDPIDLKKEPIKTAFDHPPADKDPSEMNAGDPIQYDVQDGFHKVVIWNGRRIRQREYSFDCYASLNGSSTQGNP